MNISSHKNVFGLATAGVTLGIALSLAGAGMADADPVGGSAPVSGTSPVTTIQLPDPYDIGSVMLQVELDRDSLIDSQIAELMKEYADRN